MATPGYINNGGQIIRSQPLFPFHKAKLLSLITLILILYSTNPANELPSWWPLHYSYPKQQSSERTQQQQRRRGRQKIGSFSFNFLGLEFDLFQSATAGGYGRKSSLFQRSDSLTNYFVLSLDKRLRGVDVRILNRRLTLCRFADHGDVCDWIADNMCHGMETSLVSRRQRAFSAHRYISYALFLSVLLSACAVSPCASPVACPNNLFHRPLYIIYSVFWRPRLDDFALWWFVTYPALQSLENIVSLGASTSSDATWHFYLSFLLLVVGVGGCGNLMASAILKRPVWGVKGLIAGLLGYQMSVGKSKVLLRVLGLHLVASDLVFTFFAVGCFAAVFDVSSGVLLFLAGEGFEVVTWVLGVACGNALGKFQLERYGLWYVNLF